MTKAITTNFYPINLDFEEYTILQIPNKDGLLQELRDKHNSTHSFFKKGDFIYASNKEGEDMMFGGKIETLSVVDNQQVTSSLIKHIFFRTFKDIFEGVIPIQFYPFRIVSRKKSDDLIHDTLPENLRDKIALASSSFATRMPEKCICNALWCCKHLSRPRGCLKRFLNAS